jgi:hypothetical protein
MIRFTSLYIISFLFALTVSAQVRPVVGFNERGEGNETVINIQWTGDQEDKWYAFNQDRLDVMAVKAEIQSTSLPVTKEKDAIYSFSLSSDKDYVEILLDIKYLAPGEKLALTDIRSGEILYEIRSSPSKRLLLPAFNPSTTYFKWTGSEKGIFQSRFSFSTIYLHPQDIERGGPMIGFGTALSCHPNAACKEDSIMQLISNSAIRIRMVMEEGIGWCTGAFVNNARNDKTPYILTAHHCTFEFTPQYDLWRFDLEYKSLTCENPTTEPVIFSMTGCEKKAGAQASDFLLVLLEEDVPSNHQVTFAGWNRDAIATPDTSYLVHHPNADIRKLSTSINKAVIHPNQIGWSEGYTTPADHHFRFKFTEGGHQPGSSGGPIFDQDGFLVAQLHGGTLGCEIVNNAFCGRFSKSWDAGATPSERLKEWLDPDNTGIVLLEAIDNVSQGDLIDVVGTITDPEGQPVKNVSVVITGAANDTVVTNAEGQFVFTSINRNGPYQIAPSKNDHQTNGISVLDLLAIQKHLLGKDTFAIDWKHIAADATNNQSVSVGDILVLLRLLLGKIAYLPSSPSWRFYPASIDVDSIPQGNHLEIQFQGIKIGDLNGTADPSQ